jgi:hypothetical protein
MAVMAVGDTDTAISEKTVSRVPPKDLGGRRVDGPLRPEAVPESGPCPQIDVHRS